MKIRMDPNLLKIRDANSHRIRQGKFAKPIFQAKDYLEYVNGHNLDNANKEMDMFVSHLKMYEKQLNAKENQKKI